MPASDTFVIAGGGLAGAKAAEALRGQGFDGRIVLAAEEDVRPYERPPLSKGYLQGKAGRDTIFVHPPDWYDTNHVELLLGTAVTGIDRSRRQVRLSNGGHLAYDRLLLATGSEPRRLPLPGADADGMLYLRKVGDSDRIRDTFTTASRVLIIGAGWIGLEVAAARTAGVDVTILEVADLPLLQVLGPQVAPVFAGGYDRMVFRGDTGKREFIAFWLSGGKVVAGMNVNIWDVNDAIGALIRSGQPVDPAQLRSDSIRCSTAAGSGHPTSAMSAADLMAVLLARHLRYDWDNPGEPGNDHLIFSKGHASPLLYAMFKAAGAITGEELVGGFRRFGSRLQGHPTPALPWVDVRDAGWPVVVLARTVKGKGFAEIEDKNGWHGRPLPADMAQRAVAALGGDRNLHVTTASPARHDSPHPAHVRGYVPFASTFAAFLSRGYDFLRMAGISGANIKLCGSHAGTEIGPDGPSQMAQEDLAALRAIHGSTVLYPADATAAAALTAEMAGTPGIVYLRTTRGAWPVLYPTGENFPVGGSKVLRAASGDEVTLIGAGVTVHQCLRAADDLAAGGITARVIDLYSVKPVDRATLADATAATGGRLVIAEDHYPRAAWAPPCSRPWPGLQPPPPASRCGSGSARSAACPARGPRRT